MLAYSDTNSAKPTLLFIHGLGLNKNIWNSTIQLLSPHFRCIAIDLPGHGESRATSASGRMSDYAASVREFITKMNLHDLTLVGHSMGGQIAIILSLQMSATVTKLILVATAGIESFTKEEGEKLKNGTRAIYANPLTDELLERTFFHARPEIKSLLMQEHLVQKRENFKKLSALITSSVEGMLDEPVVDYLDKIAQPVLCIYGQLDAAIPNRWLHPQQSVQDILQVASSKFSTCATVLFPFSGHYLPVDQAETLSEEILRFV